MRPLFPNPSNLMQGNNKQYAQTPCQFLRQQDVRRKQGTPRPFSHPRKPLLRTPSGRQIARLGCQSPKQTLCGRRRRVGLLTVRPWGSAAAAIHCVCGCRCLRGFATPSWRRGLRPLAPPPPHPAPVAKPVVPKPRPRPRPVPSPVHVEEEPPVQVRVLLHQAHPCERDLPLPESSFWPARW